MSTPIAEERLDLRKRRPDVLVTEGEDCDHTLTVPMRVGDVPVCSGDTYFRRCRHAVRFENDNNGRKHMLMARSDSGWVVWAHADCACGGTSYTPIFTIAKEQPRV
jgi:hypothetical protein